MIAAKMATFNNAMQEIADAETDAIFADMSSKKAEYRAFELESAIAGMEQTKMNSFKISNLKAQLIAVQSIFRYSKIEAFMARMSEKVQQLREQMATFQEYKDRYEAQMNSQVRAESFKMLNWCMNKLTDGTEKLEKSIEQLDARIESTEDPEQKALLIQQKEEAEKKMLVMNQMIREAARINQIKDDQKAMKEFYQFAQQLYMVSNPRKDMTEEQMTQRLASTMPADDSVIGYFNALIGIWDLHLEDRKLAFENQTHVRMLQSMSRLNLPSVLGVVSTGANAALTVLETQQEIQMSDDQKAVEGFKDSQNNISQVGEGVNKINEQVQAMQQQVNQQMAELDGVNREVTRQLEKLAEDVDLSQLRVAKMMDIDYINNFERVKSSSSEQVSNLIKSKEMAESKIQNNQRNIDLISRQIQEDKNKLNQIDKQKEHKKEITQKEALYLRNIVNLHPEQKSNLVNKITDFVNENKDNDSETKVVLDKSLAMLHEYLTETMGTRVVIDKRDGDRRNSIDRRTVAQAETQDTNNESRNDVAGRRKGDRRKNNHVFISEDTIKKLNIQS